MTVKTLIAMATQVKKNSGQVGETVPAFVVIIEDSQIVMTDLVARGGILVATGQNDDRRDLE